MEVIVFARNATYEGLIKPRMESLRLQDIVNTPSMTTPKSELDLGRLLLFNATITVACGKEVLEERVEKVWVAPEWVELICEISDTKPDASKARYEKAHLGRENESVRILTGGQRRISGIIPRGLRAILEAEAVQRRFIAMTDVRIETDTPEPLSSTAAYALVNVATIESIIPVAG
jgi:hypothetical protein